MNAYLNDNNNGGNRTASPCIVGKINVINKTDTTKRGKKKPTEKHMHTHTHTWERRHLLPVTDCTIAGWIKYRIETFTNQESVMNNMIVAIIL